MKISWPTVAFANIADFSLATLFASVNEEARHRSNSYANPQRKKQFLLGRLLLGQLYKLNNKNKSLPSIGYDLNGRPFFIEDNFFFSISHSGDMVVCGVSLGTRIGVDIEHVKINRNWKEIVDEYFSEREKRWIDKAEKFYAIWTIKESFLKVMGEGISSFKKISFDPRSGKVINSFGFSGYVNSFFIGKYVCSVAFCSQKILRFSVLLKLSSEMKLSELVGCEQVYKIYI